MGQSWLVESIAPVRSASAQLIERGKQVSTSFLLEVGDESCVIDVHCGAVTGIHPFPIVMPQWTFAIRAERGAWEHYWSAQPPPGYNDLFAMLKRSALRFEGDLYPLMSNLLYFKELLALPRGDAA